MQAGGRLLIFTVLCQQADENEANNLESPQVPQGEGLTQEEMFSAGEQLTETEEDTQEACSPPLQDQEQVADICTIFLPLEISEPERRRLSIRRWKCKVMCSMLNQNCTDCFISGGRGATLRWHRWELNSRWWWSNGGNWEWATCDVTRRTWKGFSGKGRHPAGGRAWRHDESWWNDSVSHLIWHCEYFLTYHFVSFQEGENEEEQK